jgi:hypothetical protein
MSVIRSTVDLLDKAMGTRTTRRRSSNSAAFNCTALSEEYLRSAGVSAALSSWRSPLALSGLSTSQ